MRKRQNHDVHHRHLGFKVRALPSWPHSIWGQMPVMVGVEQDGQDTNSGLKEKQDDQAGRNAEEEAIV